MSFLHEVASPLENKGVFSIFSPVAVKVFCDFAIARSWMVPSLNLLLLDPSLGWELLLVKTCIIRTKWCKLQGKRMRKRWTGFLWY